MTLTWRQYSGVYPWRARTASGEYEVASYLGTYGPRFLGWFKTGKAVTPVSDMSGDIEVVKTACELHARRQEQ